MQPAVGSATGRRGAPPHSTTTTLPPPPRHHSSQPNSHPSPSAHRRHPSPLIFMNHTPRVFESSCSPTSWTTTSTTASCSGAELDGAQNQQHQQHGGDADEEPQTHVHLLEGKSIDEGAVARHKAAPLPPNDGADSTTSSSSSSINRDRSGSGSPCWWNLPDQPFWPENKWSIAAAGPDDVFKPGGSTGDSVATTTTTATTTTATTSAPLLHKQQPRSSTVNRAATISAANGGTAPPCPAPPFVVARKSLHIDTSFPGVRSAFDGVGVLPVVSNANSNFDDIRYRRPSFPTHHQPVRPVTRGRRFSSDHLLETPPFIPAAPPPQSTHFAVWGTNVKLNKGSNRGNVGRKMSAVPSAGEPRLPAASMGPEYNQFDLAHWLRNTGPADSGAPSVRSASGGTGGGVGGRRGSKAKHRSALRIFGYKRRKSLAERVGTVEGGPDFPKPEPFVPKQGVVQKVSNKGTKYLQIVTNQSQDDSQSLASQPLASSKSEEMLPMKRRSKSLPISGSLEHDPCGLWVSSLPFQQESEPSESGGTTDDAASKGPLRVTNPTDPSSDAQSSTVAESVRLVSSESAEIKTSYATAMDAKAALFSNPPSCLPTPTAVITSESIEPVEPKQEDERPATSGTDRTIQEDSVRHTARGPTRKTSSERLAGQGMRRPSKEHARVSPSNSTTAKALSNHNSSSADELNGHHNRVDSVMTDTSSSSTDRDDLRAGTLHMSRRNREDRTRSRKLRDLQQQQQQKKTKAKQQQQQQRHHHSHHHLNHQQQRSNIDEIVAQPLDGEEKTRNSNNPPAIASTTTTTTTTTATTATDPSACDQLERAKMMLRRKKDDGNLRPASLLLVPGAGSEEHSPGYTTGYTPVSGGSMTLSPVVTVAEQMPLPRGTAAAAAAAGGKQVRSRPAKLVLRDHSAHVGHAGHHGGGGAAGSGGHRRRSVIAVRTSLSGPSKDDLELAHGGGGRGRGNSRSSRHALRRRSSSFEDAGLGAGGWYDVRRASSLKFVPGRGGVDEQQQQQQPQGNGGHRVFRDSKDTLRTPSAMSVVSSSAAAAQAAAAGRSSVGSSSRVDKAAEAGGVAEGGAVVKRLQARLEALERQNRLLEAALNAVLSTSGALNACPCSLSERDSFSGSAGSTSGSAGSGSRRGESWRESGATDLSALDVYLGTRMGTGAGRERVSLGV